jgi:hypothetical protein
MSAPVQCPRGAMERACHAFDQMAWPCGIEPACHIERIKQTLSPLTRKMAASVLQGRGRIALGIAMVRGAFLKSTNFSS